MNSFQRCVEVLLVGITLCGCTRVATSAPTPLMPPVATGTMEFRGPMEGGPGYVSLTSSGPGSYLATIRNASPTGGGKVVGTVVRDGPALRMTSASDGSECKLSLEMTSSTMTVREMACMSMHGVTVSFNGILDRVH